MLNANEFESKLERDGLKCNLNVEISGDALKERVTKKLKDIAVKMQLKGFRPGKVPVKIVNKRYFGSAFQEEINDAIDNSLKQSITDKKLSPVNNPQIDLDENINFKNITHQDSIPNIIYNAKFEVFPQIEEDKIKYQNIVVTENKITISDKEVNDEFDFLKLNAAEWKKVTRKIKKSDKVKIEYNLSIQDSKDYQSKKDIKEFILDNAIFINDEITKKIESVIIGSTVDTEHEIAYKLPDNFSLNESLSNKECILKIKILEASAATKNIDMDKIFSSYSVQNEEELKAALKDNLENFVKQEQNKKIDDEVLNKFIEENKIESLPEILLQKNIDNIIHNILKEKINLQEANKDLIAKERDSLAKSEDIQSQAKMYTTLEVYINFFITNDKIKLSTDEQRFLQMAQNKILNYKLEDSVKKAYLEQIILNTWIKKFTEHVKERIKIESSSKNFDEVFDRKMRINFLDDAS